MPDRSERPRVLYTHEDQDGGHLVIDTETIGVWGQDEGAQTELPMGAEAVKASEAMLVAGKAGTHLVIEQTQLHRMLRASQEKGALSMRTRAMGAVHAPHALRHVDTQDWACATIRRIPLLEDPLDPAQVPVPTSAPADAEIDALLAPIAQRADAAPTGVYQVGASPTGSYQVGEVTDRYYTIPGLVRGPRGLNSLNVGTDQALGEFFAHAFEDVPTLVALARALVEERATTREILHDLRNQLMETTWEAEAARSRAEDMKEDIAWLESQRDRYRTAWTSARRRARQGSLPAPASTTLFAAARAAVHYVDGEGWFVREPGDPAGEGELAGYAVPDAMVRALLPLIPAHTPGPEQFPPLPLPLDLPCGHTGLPDPNALHDQDSAEVLCPECQHTAAVAECTQAVSLDRIRDRHSRAAENWYMRAPQGRWEVGSADRLEPVAALEADPQGSADAVFLIAAHHDMGHLLNLVDRLHRQRDLAIAHDRQPYRTLADASQIQASQARPDTTRH